MSLADEYKRQFGWRSWQTLLDALPRLSGQTVLDLGCAVGDQAAELVARGARVIGLEANEELLLAAQSRGLPNAEFRQADLRALADPGVVADGIWSSFVAAFFPDLSGALASWSRFLRPGGWIALTEIDDLFGHLPLSVKARSLLDGYARDAVLAGRYDFHMGHQLAVHLERAGFAVAKEFTVEDQELSFRGPAQPDVVEAWRLRFERMKLLQDFCGEDFERVRDEFLACLGRSDHESAAKVCCCIGIKPAPDLSGTAPDR